MCRTCVGSNLRSRMGQNRRPRCLSTARISRIRYANKLSLQVLLLIIYFTCCQTEPVVYTGSFFGDGDYPIVYSNFQCVGPEDDLYACEKDEYLTFSCPRSQVASMLCGYGKDYYYYGDGVG